MTHLVCSWRTKGFVRASRQTRSWSITHNPGSLQFINRPLIHHRSILLNTEQRSASQSHSNEKNPCYSIETRVNLALAKYEKKKKHTI